MTNLVKKWKLLARRDDLFTHHMVPSDVRQLIGEIERLRVCLEWLDQRNRLGIGVHERIQAALSSSYD